MKKIGVMLISSVMVLYASFSFAQAVGERNWLGADTNAMTEKTFWQFVQRLELTDVQKAQIKPLFSQQQEQYQKIKKDSSLSAQDKQSRIETVNRMTHDKVLSTLTPIQRNQLRSMAGFQP